MFSKLDELVKNYAYKIHLADSSYDVFIMHDTAMIKGDALISGGSDYVNRRLAHHTWAALEAFDRLENRQ